MTRVLLTGFEPFDGADVNPSWEVARLVADQPPEGLAVTAVRLSCVFGQAAGELRAAVTECAPDLVVCLGQAAGRPDVTVERVAVNVDDARIPDNAGARPVDVPVVPGGPAAYFATLPVKACVAAVRAAGLPASLSHTAGTFVCNHVFYTLMHLLATERPGVRGGFVHLPALPEQVLDRAQPSLPADSLAHALRALLTAAATTCADLRVPEGATH
ncbi:pyroglutamyl-peptidase I [Streptomyces sp. SP17BM10]|uniref:pyroglutamyl-peptidase I n=1 Tax=Streptomyces sp. SP17BM10 TaxID=3002530 RepID=UPI002E77E7D4|nr:pyroglutamyl-peptidase I [Streptomyces sp. SP17BM10]MEE1785776.1 pyroglutamyl-peptidase I [Streptomyces sp. SP17BM10]